MQTKKMRLNRYISLCGVCSRRKADDLIKSNKVHVNGKLVSTLGHIINPGKDKVKVGGKPIAQQHYAYYVFNKPKNVLSTMSDPKGRPTVFDYFKTLGKGLFPVGRLDWDAEGIMILTNDGEFANKLAHPRWGVDKTYLVKLKGTITQAQLNKLKTGVSIIGGKVKSKEATKLERKRGGNDWVRITISEGKNRQIKRMFEKIGFDVLKIQRISIGTLMLKGLKKGGIREITKPTVIKLTHQIQKNKSSFRDDR